MAKSDFQTYARKPKEEPKKIEIREPKLPPSKHYTPPAPGTISIKSGLIKVKKDA